MESKKIGIITILNVNNYGAELQAFALQHKLNSLGYSAEIINYFFYKNPSYIHCESANSLFPVSLKTRMKEKALVLIDQYNRLKNSNTAKVRSLRFSEFHSKNTKLSPSYTSYNSLYNHTHDYDVFIVGSDQVWNPNNPINLNPYFLTFAPKEALKISYASSFGVSTISSQYHDVYKSLLNNIDILSCREESGVQIIREVTDREATHVVDPTLLLSKNEWEEISIPSIIEDKYILLFIFKESQYIKKLATELSSKTGYRIIRICKDERRVESDKEVLNLRDLGPKEFLGIFKKASFIITTSFHGTVFSLIFEIPFYTITPSSKNNNARQESLLKKVGLSDRLIKEDQPFPDLSNSTLDFNTSTKIIEQERAKSLLYLDKAINSRKGANSENLSN